MIIAIDFDDTLTEESPYPITGKIKKKEIQMAIKLKKQGHYLVLWTGRKGKYLKEAINLCKLNGLEFDEIAKNKYVADCYVDSKAIKSLKELEKYNGE